MVSTGAMAEGPTVYGRVNVSLDYYNIDPIVEDNATEWRVDSHASRFGVKGDQELTSGLTGFYKLEWQVDVADEAKEFNFVSRSQYAGVKGGFGSVLAGRNDTPLKAAQGKVDLFNDLAGDIKHFMGGEYRASHVVQYTSPKFSNVQLSAMIIPGQGEGEGEDDIASGQSYSAVYNADGLHLALAYDYNTLTQTGLIDDKGISRNDIARGVVGYQAGAGSVGFLYQTTENAADGSDLSEDAFLISASYKVSDTTLKIQYVQAEMDGDDVVSTDADKGSEFSLGADHSLSKSTTVYGYYTLKEYEVKDVSGTENEDVFGVGLSMKF